MFDNMLFCNDYYNNIVQVAADIVCVTIVVVTDRTTRSCRRPLSALFRRHIFSNIIRNKRRRRNAYIRPQCWYTHNPPCMPLCHTGCSTETIHNTGCKFLCLHLCSSKTRTVREVQGFSSFLVAAVFRMSTDAICLVTARFFDENFLIFIVF